MNILIGNNKKENWTLRNKEKLNIIIKLYKPPTFPMNLNIQLNLIINKKLINLMITLLILIEMNTFSTIPQKNDIV